jgi:hypothetical protein
MLLLHTLVRTVFYQYNERIERSTVWNQPFIEMDENSLVLALC